MIPLRWKLVALYVAILIAVIGGFSVALAAAVQRNLFETADRELEARARAICALVEYEEGRWHVEPKSRIPEEYTEERGLYYSIVDKAGQVVLKSRNAPEPPPADGARSTERGFREVSVTLTKLADADEGWGSQTVRVVAGKSQASIDESMAALRTQLAIIGPGILLLSVLGGLLLVSRALRPIEKIARTAQEINASDLSRRIEVKGSDELGRLAATLNGMFDRLQEAFDRQTRFTADASHELRTPLSVIAGSVELGLKRPRSPEEHRELLEDVREATARMRSIVEGLLTLARADAGAVQLRRERVSVTSLADEMARLHRPLAEEKGVKIAVESEGDVEAMGDPERLKELIGNLLSNAIRYNKPGGTVAVKLSRAVDRAQMVVDDTGIGIPAEDLPRIFERFYRVDKARSREAGGNGLGLAIVKWIVEAHRGSISVTSEAGRGSRFVVTLPAGS
jgi:heavy metal sensor kinase